jgi:signal transduction histidine kinase
MMHAGPPDDGERHLQQQLHDELGQCLSLAVMQIDAAQAAPEPDALQHARAFGLCDVRQRLNLIGARLRWRNSGPGGVQARISRVPA